MTHIRVVEELTQFAGQVPERAADPAAFEDTALFRTMRGIRIAATGHAALVKDMQQVVTAADSGMEAYRQAARTIEANYRSTDAENAVEQARIRDLSDATFRQLNALGVAEDSQTAVAPGMAAPSDLAPEKATGYWSNEYDGLPNTLPGTGKGVAPAVPPQSSMPPMPASPPVVVPPPPGRLEADIPYPLGPM